MEEKKSAAKITLLEILYALHPENKLSGQELEIYNALINDDEIIEYLEKQK